MFLSPLPPNFDAALRDVRSRKLEFRLAAAGRLSDPPDGRGADAMEALGVLAHDETARARAAAFESLGQLQHPGVMAFLQRGVEDPAPLVREAAVRGLAEHPGAAAEALLESCIQSPHPEVRFHAISGLAQCAPGMALARVGEVLADHDAHVRLNSVSAYRLLLPSEASPADAVSDVEAEASKRCETAIAPLLADPDDAVRFEAALTLAACESVTPLPEAVLPELLRALDDRDRALDAASAVSELARAQRLAHDGPLALRALTRKVMRFRTNAHLKVSCAVGMVMLGDLQGLSPLRKAIRSRWNPARPFAVELAGRFCIRPLRNELSELKVRPKGLLPDLVQEALQQIPPRLAPPKSAEEQLRHAPQ